MLKKAPQGHLFSQKMPAAAQQVLLWQVSNSTIKVGTSKKALRKEPKTTDPQCLVRSRKRGECQWAYWLFQYQSVALPETQKLTGLCEMYRRL